MFHPYSSAGNGKLTRFFSKRTRNAAHARAHNHNHGIDITHSICPSAVTTSCSLIAGILGVVYFILSLYSLRVLDHFLLEENTNLNRNIYRGSTSLLHVKRKPATERDVIAIGQLQNDYIFDKTRAEQALEKYGPSSIHRILTAYIEPPLNDTLPGTGSRGDLNHDKDHGVPPQFKIPLPLRKSTPNDLTTYEYPSVKSCRDMPGKFPIDRGLQYDEKGHLIVWNVGDTPTPDDFPLQEAPYCPVEMDPFLPWIHDVFPSQDGSRIEFIAQNKRRCRTGTKFTKDVDRLVPQVSLMQSISVQRISEQQARMLAPELWSPSTSTSDTVGHDVPRYRLAPYNESSPDGKFTRFICRFHGTDFPASGGPPQTFFIAETLSEFPFNYEFVAYRKGTKANAGLLTPKGKDTMLYWTSNIRFHCPVPNVGTLRRDIATGHTVLSDGTPTIYIDLVPIRTSTRYTDIYLTEEQIGPREQWGKPAFDPIQRWGPKNVIPRVEASGRWSNIPICLPPTLPSSSALSISQTREKDSIIAPQPALSSPASTKKPYVLSACLWAATEFKTRGHSRLSHSDTLSRLIEWIEFHLMVGFDHIFLYDNSGAHTNASCLEDIARLYPDHITRIDWPSIPCNNNIPAHDSTGERSSQYAAENSCRTRFAPFTEWIAAFDTDEYLVPMGKYNSLKDVLKDAYAGGTQILSFRSSRGKLRPDKSNEVDHGLTKKNDATFLEAYNCDSGGIPKPSWGDRARKQIYRSDFVLYHYVHYSTVTTNMLHTYAESGEHGGWRRNFFQSREAERVTDEINEAVMVHTKTVVHDQTRHYKKEACHKDYRKKWLGCFVAFPWPDGVEKNGEESYDKDGMMYNCFVNEKVENHWVPLLRDRLQKRNAAMTVVGRI